MLYCSTLYGNIALRSACDEMQRFGSVLSRPEKQKNEFSFRGGDISSDGGTLGGKEFD